MVKIKIRGKRYNCPTKWGEVKDLAGLCTKSTLRDEINFLTGSDLEGIPDDQVFPLITLTSFLEEFDLPTVEAADVNAESYFKMQSARGILTLPGRAYIKLYQLCKLYHPERTETVQILSTGAILLDRITLFLSAYEEMFAYEPEAEEIQAGIEELSGLSAFATVYNLAGKDILKMDAVGESTAAIVYGALFYNFKEAEYQKRLNEIRYPKPTT